MFYHTGHFAFLYGVMLTLCLVVLFAVSSQWGGLRNVYCKRVLFPFT
jgi:hypothetical protein